MRTGIAALVVLLLSWPAWAESPMQMAKASGPEANAWTWGNWEVEGTDAKGNPMKAKRASTPEISGKGSPLILEECKGSVLSFADGSEENFWQGDPVDNGGARVGWIRLKGDDQSVAAMFEGGLDGYYFDMDISGKFSLIGAKMLKGATFGICPARNSSDKACRWFEGHGLDKAIAFVCGPRARR